MLEKVIYPANLQNKITYIQRSNEADNFYK